MNRRTWLRYSLRTLLGATAVSTIPLWWLRSSLQKAREQERIIAQLTAMGAVVGYAHEWDKQRDCFSGASMPGSRILRKLLGDHFFLRPDCVMVSEVQGTASSLEMVSELKELTSLAVVDSPKIDDQIIDIMMALPNLEFSSLYATAVTSKGVGRLQDHPSLRTIVLSHTKVSRHELGGLRRVLPKCTIKWDDDPYVRLSELIGTK